MVLQEQSWLKNTLKSEVYIKLTKTVTEQICSYKVIRHVLILFYEICMY